MLAVELGTQIREFVNAFDVVEERQVIKFFKGAWGIDEITHELNYQKSISQLYEHKLNPNDPDEPIKLSTVRRLPTTLHDYRRIIKAVNVLCRYRSDEINFFIKTDFPTEVFFITSNDVVYEVSVFDESNWVTKFALTTKARTERLPDGVSDPTNYIAVVPSSSVVVNAAGKPSVPKDSMIARIHKLGFTYYVTVERDGTTQSYEI